MAKKTFHVKRGENAGVERTRALGSIMNQGGDAHRDSAETLPELLHQGRSTKSPGDPSDFTKSGAPSLGRLMQQGGK